MDSVYHCLVSNRQRGLSVPDEYKVPAAVIALDIHMSLSMDTSRWHGSRRMDRLQISSQGHND